MSEPSSFLGLLGVNNENLLLSSSGLVARAATLLRRCRGCAGVKGRAIWHLFDKTLEQEDMRWLAADSLVVCIVIGRYDVSGNRPMWG